MAKKHGSKSADAGREYYYYYYDDDDDDLDNGADPADHKNVKVELVKSTAGRGSNKTMTAIENIGTTTLGNASTTVA